MVVAQRTCSTQCRSRPVVVEHGVPYLRVVVFGSLYLAPFEGHMYFETSPSQDVLCVAFQLVCKGGINVVCHLSSPFYTC